MAGAPKDGTRVLVQIRASEQGAAEVDVARWARPDRAGEACWIAADSDPEVPIIYAEAELLCWMPMPAPLPRMRSARSAAGAEQAAPGKRVPQGDAASIEARDDEIGGSGI